MTEEKIVKMISFFIILIAALFLIIYKYIPEYKASIGSSDTYLNIESFKEIININIQSGPEFILVTNEENKISNILFINKNSLCLYNKNIENDKTNSSINNLLKILNDNNYLNNKSINITSYNSTNKLKTILIDQIKKYYSTVVITESTNTLPLVDQKTLLQEKEIESRNNIKSYKGEKSSEESNTNLTEEEAFIYADNICQKLSVYATKISNQEKDSPNYPIQLISGEDAKSIYPSAKSWYYINDNKVLGYINFKSEKYDYSYCCQDKVVLRGSCHE